jgi:hypothetical protein
LRDLPVGLEMVIFIAVLPNKAQSLLEYCAGLHQSFCRNFCTLGIKGS